MARTNENHAEVNETENAAAPNGLDLSTLDDSAIYMMVDGFVGFLPFERHEAISVNENVALNEGRKQMALRGGQTVVKRALREGKDPREALQDYLNGFQANAETEFQTVASKRLELGRELLAERLEATGKAAVAEQVRAGKPVIDPRTKADILPNFMAKYAGEINNRLGAWASMRHETKKRGTGGAVELSLDSGFDDLFTS